MKNEFKNNHLFDRTGMEPLNVSNFTNDLKAVFLKHKIKTIKDAEFSQGIFIGFNEEDKFCLMNSNVSSMDFDEKIAEGEGESKVKQFIFNVERKGQISDGYHSFDQLYHHRMILFAVICHDHAENAWKSWKHHDGTMYDDYFIVGIETPVGQFTYHYHKDNWNLFDVKEVESAPEWDGHTADDVTRLLSLKQMKRMESGIKTHHVIINGAPTEQSVKDYTDKEWIHLCADKADKYHPYACDTDFILFFAKPMDKEKYDAEMKKNGICAGMGWSHS